MLPNDIAALIGFACEAALWGMYVILFGISMVLFLLRSTRGTQSSYTLAVASTVLFLACTGHFAIEFNHFYTVLWATGVDGFSSETTPLIGADLLISTCDLLGDFILLYRCWMVWGRNWYIILLPSMTAIAGFACIAQAIHFIITTNSTASVPPPAIVPLTTASYALPLCTNAMTTGLIVFHIWRFTSRYKDENGETLSLPSTARLARTASGIIIESGVLYLVAQLTLVVLVSIKHPAEAIVAVGAVQIYGIAPTLIIIRVGLGRAFPASKASAASTTTPFERIWAARRGEGLTMTTFTSTMEDTTHSGDATDGKGSHIQLDLSRGAESSSNVGSVLKSGSNRVEFTTA
ncbi:uncharacterized protein BXZ73DRAFT_41625 [Epithele typhae]|uniref:uncharacterized protein n=1 Tax=Epithele typhae TaxID=378194 RepID=UPI0020075DFA|nr:uncharacterized protein BXZ73DRAFT_41625 [Epithele typhae]KAH9941746.1 hypothetical protein BXZ73DRAFT_41625 [Epithele typhae]